MDRLRRRRGRNRSNIGHAKVTLHGSHNEVKIGSQRSHNIGSDFSNAQRALAREVTVLANVGDCTKYTNMYKGTCYRDYGTLHYIYMTLYCSPKIPSAVRAPTG